eukprot:Skav217249  [mRNA]  locus=scaffold47:77603:81445:- [translate_table: standard]
MAGDHFSGCSAGSHPHATGAQGLERCAAEECHGQGGSHGCHATRGLRLWHYRRLGKAVGTGCGPIRRRDSAAGSSSTRMKAPLAKTRRR